MRIEDLDEFQGLTPQMVREWLQELDPAIKPSDSMADDIQAVSDLCGDTPQSLLREINPRMRGPGYPSDAAARAHGDGGWWVFQHPGDGELHMAQMHLSQAWNDVRFYWEGGLMGEPCDEACMWWPCDEHGNKVRWPEKDGVML